VYIRKQTIHILKAAIHRYPTVLALENHIFILKNMMMRFKVIMELFLKINKG
jgi:hypothetical protein